MEEVGDDSENFNINSDSEEEYTDASGTDIDEEVTWIEWFCHLKGNEFFVEVDDEYIQDDFNLTHLNKEVQYYEQALNTILDYDDQEVTIKEEEKPLVEHNAQMLYGLIHARFILTSKGMAAMYEKYKSYVYGSCPLLDCHAQNQAVLPLGMCDDVRQGGTKVYCPRCQEIYYPKSSRLENIDGAFFGTSFPHIFFLSYTHLVPANPPRIYVPRIYGFKVCRDAGRCEMSKKDAAHILDTAVANSTTKPAEHLACNISTVHSMQTGAELMALQLQQQQQKGLQNSGGGGGSSSSRPKAGQLDQQPSNLAGTKAGKDEEAEDDDDMAVGPGGDNNAGGDGDDPEDSLGIGPGDRDRARGSKAFAGDTQAPR